MEEDVKKIYFITDGEFVKIGLASDPEQRLRSLQTGNPKELKLIYSINGSLLLEDIFHTIFKDINVRGEWFKYTESLMAFISIFKEYGYDLTCDNKMYGGITKDSKMFFDGKVNGNISETILAFLGNESWNDEGFTGLTLDELYDKFGPGKRSLVKLSIIDLIENKKMCHNWINGTGYYCLPEV